MFDWMMDFLGPLLVGLSAVGALGFLLGAFIEESLSPFPSPLLLLGVALFLNKPVSWEMAGDAYSLILVPVAVGATLGSLVLYDLAYVGGKSAINRFNRRVGFSWEKVEKFEEKLKRNKYDGLAIYLARATPFVPGAVITAASGILRIRFTTFLLATFCGVLTRATIIFFAWVSFGQVLFD